jgi:hypothetical protein
MMAILLGTVASSALIGDGVVVISPHRYWRVKIHYTGSTSAGAGTFGLYEGEYPYTTNLATDAAKLSSDVTVAPYTTDSLVDGSTSTTWYSAGSNYGSKFIAYDFGAGNAKAITAFSWGLSTTLSSPQLRCPIAASLEWSDDGTTWYRSFTMADAVDWSKVTSGSKTFDVFGDTSRPIDDPAFKANWRVVFLDTLDVGNLILSEMAFRTEAGGVNRMTDTSYVIYNINSLSTQEMEDMIDGNNGSVSAYATTQSYNHYRFYGYRFLVDTDIREVAILPSTLHNGYENYAPTNMIVQWSSDGIIWNSAAQFFNIRSWVGVQTNMRTFAVPLVPKYEGLRAGQAVVYALRKAKAASLSARRHSTYTLRKAKADALAARRSTTYVLIKGV